METTQNGNIKMNSCPSCSYHGGESLLEAPDRFHGRSQKYHLTRCSRCALVRTEDPPPPSKIGEHYGLRYDQSITSAGADPSRWAARLAILRKHFPGGGAILDLGCSSGDFLGSLPSSAWRRYGIEMSEAAAAAARTRAGAEVFVGDILAAPYAPASFDVITCFHVFEHLYQPREVLEKVSTWLKPGGIFYAMMPNIDSAGAKIFGSFWYALELPRHICHYSPGSLARLANSVGLTPLSLTTHREVFIEPSLRYLMDDLLLRVGISRTPLAQAKPPGIPLRVVRKAFRLTMLKVLTGLASCAGDGESIHAILRKPECVEGSTPRELATVACDAGRG